MGQIESAQHSFSQSNAASVTPNDESKLKVALIQKETHRFLKGDVSIHECDAENIGSVLVRMVTHIDGNDEDKQ
ncbi:hypothetical protein KY290_028749 [Solanum tuberosum]|uniref:Uncharacterized protein n=1 Tax=Solanum tuberosum TaxID=4113 RepID=A0ABQ7UIU5_SOLTU|nr:hypothetical protein KY290_028749 [Solanum tuberosum]